MKIGPEFRPNPAHRYNLPAGVLVQSAKFPRQVDIWQEPEPSPIWRGTPPTEVGRGSLRLWKFVVHGKLSGTTTTEAAARSEGERWATEGKANHRPRYTHDAKAEAAAFAAYLKDIGDRFPS